jgi:hypothetical protein
METLTKLKMPSIDFQFIRVVDNRLVISYIGLDRVSQQPATVRFVEELPERWPSMTDEEQLSFARFIIIKAMTHELDEYLFISGLGKDPHANSY